MKIQRFIAIGLVSLTLLVGCNTNNQTVSSETGKAASEKAETEQTLVAEEGGQTENASSAEPAAEPEVDPAVENKKAAEEQIKSLASLIGKSQSDVKAVMGEASMSKNLDNTDILLVDYYKVEYLNEIAKVEVIYNDDAQKVNFVSFVILAADDIDNTKENLSSTLTDLYGESSIERIVDVKGKRNLNWTDGTLIYDLKYFGSNISLDIYEADK